MTWDRDEFIERGVIVGIVVLILTLCCLFVYAANQDEKQWAEYAKTHHCRAVGTRAGQVAIAPNGQAAITADQTIYQCDDGAITIR